MPTVSDRGRIMPDSPIRKLAPLAQRAKERGIKVFHLNIGQPDLPTPKEALAAIQNIDRTILEYTPSEGIFSFRQKLAKYYHKFDIDVQAEDIIITSGGSEAVTFAFMSCLDPGDEIIVPEPAYANYEAFAIVAGAKIRSIAANIEEGFSLPPVEEFEKLITPKTKGIMICNPNNPTGYLYTQQEMNEIRDLVKKYDLYLFSDEVYREFCYTGAPYISAFHLEGIEQNVVLIDSVSKRYSECGLRIGALITKNAAVKKNVMKFCQARLSPPLIGQIAAEASLDADPEYMLNNYNEYVNRRKFLIDGLNRIDGVYSPIPMGAFYTVARLPVDNSDRFCEWLLSDFDYEGQTIFLAPASGFYTVPDRGQDEVRIAYVLKKEDLAKALKILEEALKVYPGSKVRRVEIGQESTK
ncbi:pyridoxal phosphate-dependent aminotransferase [Maribellus sp. CM-23]|uniref:pyridoxal phosphate-dependent aminotransferase n=1 Tax=Maribellus sp. CM-23 TaxID=2781026 RepID=UPI001F4044C2|nr:pyridoxal phosphate-dependent aminotransferase [Maribellus sp. CM-23]MCE4563522.1 pyridoxal phosphate-dependent aminotransferase [Maribellus sp. CM-23]